MGSDPVKYSKKFLRKVARVQAFLDLNYPCGCDVDDRECEKNYYEAVEIVNLVQSKDYVQYGEK